MYLLLRFIVLFNLLTFFGSAHAFDVISGCTSPTAPANCVELTGCDQGSSLINTSGKYYLLVNDVNANGSCFSISAASLTLDLNGKNINYARTTSGIGVQTSNPHLDNITVKNGSLIGGNFAQSHAVRLGSNDDTSADNLTIDSLHISASGQLTHGIVVGRGQNINVTNNILNLNSSRPGCFVGCSNSCSHYGEANSGIGISGRKGRTYLYNNKIMGKTMIGISLTDCTDDPNDGVADENLIQYNYISYEAMITDGYAIGMAARNGHCSGTVISDNIIDQINGRGIAYSGWDNPWDYGANGAEIRNNTISVQEGSNCEGSPNMGNSYGMRIRFGGGNVKANYNYIRGYAGRNVGVNYSSAQGGSIVGMQLGNSEPYGDGNEYNYNHVEVSSTDYDLSQHGYGTWNAVALASEGGYERAGQVFPAAASSYRYNTLVSNVAPFWASYAQGIGNNARYEGTRIVQGPNPRNYRPFVIGFWYWGASALNFVNTYPHGVTNLSSANFEWASDGNNTIYQDIDISWLARVQAVDSHGNPLSGVAVQATGNGMLRNATTDSSGVATLELIEKKYHGQNQLLTSTYNPYNFKATYNNGGSPIERNLNNLTVNAPLFQRLVFETVNSAGSDLSAPFRMNAEPNGTLPPGTTQTLLRIETDENATCTYSDSRNSQQLQMQGAGSRLHSANVSNLVGGVNYIFNVRCTDGATNMNSDDFAIRFWVARNLPPRNPVDQSAPAAPAGLMLQ